MTKIIVTLSSKTLSDLTKEIEQLKKYDDAFDIVEFRGDYYDESVILAALEKIQALHKRVLYTYRTKSEGGSGKTLDYKNHLTYIINEASIDLLDIEYYQLHNPQFVAEVKKRHIDIVYSHHNFTETPSIQAMTKTLDLMASSRNYLKLAYMPTSDEDVEDMFEVLIYGKEKYGNIVTTISMGERGKVTRVAKPPFNSCFTYGCVEDSQAPGQVEITTLRDIYGGYND